MSHVEKLKLFITDLDALEQCAPSLGLRLERGATSYKWWGRSVGDYPIPAGFTEADLGRCEHKLVVEGNNEAFEIGLVRRRDGQPGYEMLFDFYGHRGDPLLKALGGKEGNRLKQAYGATVAANYYAELGYETYQTRDADGTVQVIATKN
jgi:hypothetical protein